MSPVLNSARIARFIAVAGLWLTWNNAKAESSLEQDWDSPPRDARVRAYWWWLNGNVTREAITRDLEQMKAKGFGGALICDADGSSQDGNERVPHGPTFFSPEWRELYKHTLREASRLNLEISLNIQSGWNLGGPTVKAEDAAKKLVWSETVAQAGNASRIRLAEPKHADPWYHDLFVVAYPIKEEATAEATVTASSQRNDHPAQHAADGNNDSLWVSQGTKPGEGPTRSAPEWLQINFQKPVEANSLTVTPRPEYGPRECDVEISDDGKTFRRLTSLTLSERNPAAINFPAQRGRYFRIMMYGAYDPRSPASPRQVQVAELSISGTFGQWPAKSHRPIEALAEKALHRSLHFSAPDTSSLLSDVGAQAGEEDTSANAVVDLSKHLAADGTLQWTPPSGAWRIIRLGCTVGDHSRVSTSSEGWQGYALDVLDEPAFKRYWDAIVEPLIQDAGPLAGKTLRYLHTDSWEVEAINWTPTLRTEFRQRRGYEILPWLPVITGRIVNSREESNRFLHDFRKTIGDLAIDHHLRPFKAWAAGHGLEIHPESGGPHAVPIDAQRCLGQNNVPMAEFWAASWRHRIGDANRFFIKQPASAAHTYGHRLVAAEGFTTIGPHWQETLWDNLKPSFDKACTEGLNLLVWHAWVCSPAAMGIPGQQYFAGTHLNPNVTWWEMSGSFFAYLNRCQALLQRGQSVSDVLYYYGDHVPNFAQLRASDPAKVGPGYDYDVITEEALLTRITVRDSRFILPDGTSYRVLALPPHERISLPVVKKIEELAATGGTIVGRMPKGASSLNDWQKADDEVQSITNRLWTNGTIKDISSREALASVNTQPDFQVNWGSDPADISYIHRRDGTAEIYFIASRSKRTEEAQCTFRVSGKAPELWDAVTGQRRFASQYETHTGLTTVPISLPPCGSIFVIFRADTTAHPPTGRSNSATVAPIGDISGPWMVSFSPQWKGPANVEFSDLISWTDREEPGIRYYSGTATYRTTFDADKLKSIGGSRATWLDLGEVHELASVTLNNQPLGVVWAPPFQVKLSQALKPTGNILEVSVVNFWPNRIIGDASLPSAERVTRTNIRQLKPDTKLMPSGLLGPVRLLGTPAE